ncbi:MAG: hypothetical protein LIO39_05360, partial [Lachnospiraceae bacterium]|nr:hypothetical protein [Lachnospiraceae bacterium]
ACLDRFRRIEHQRWLRFYAFYHWSFGESQDEALRHDPRLKSYEELTQRQRAYCDYSWELLGELQLKNEAAGG